MKSSWVVGIWAVIFIVLSIEYGQYHRGQPGFLEFLKTKNVISKSYNTSLEPGRPTSLILGWAGISVMILTNLYILRKRAGFMQRLGSMRNWLNFHILCGMVGPTFILFHSNFKVRGLVAISFWSMVVSVASGVVGRYFYSQIAGYEHDFKAQADHYIKRLKTHISRMNLSIPEAHLQIYMDGALAMAGGSAKAGNPFVVLGRSFIGDIRLATRSIPAPAEAGQIGKFALKNYAVNLRRANNLQSFKKLMAYWHTFHMPFAIFMYLAAIAHIIAVNILGVA